MTNRVKLATIRHLNDYYGFEHLNPMIAVQGIEIRTSIYRDGDESADL